MKVWFYSWLIMINIFLSVLWGFSSWLLLFLKRRKICEQEEHEEKKQRSRRKPTIRNKFCYKTFPIFVLQANNHKKYDRSLFRSPCSVVYWQHCKALSREEIERKLFWISYDEARRSRWNKIKYWLRFGNWKIK